jgi:glycosyltransferase involved in cell wall biosynthesis
VEPVKRLHLVLDAIAHLRQEGHKAELALMGDGPALLHLLQWAKSRWTPLRIHQPARSRDAVHRFLCGIDV